MRIILDFLFFTVVVISQINLRHNKKHAEGSKRCFFSLQFLLYLARNINNCCNGDSFFCPVCTERRDADKQ